MRFGSNAESRTNDVCAHSCGHPDTRRLGVAAIFPVAWLTKMPRAAEVHLGDEDSAPLAFQVVTWYVFSHMYDS